MNGPHPDGIARLPLTRAQLGIWFGVALDPASPAFDCAEYTELPGRVAETEFRAAADRALAEAEGLRARFEVSGGVPAQYLLPTARAPRTTVRDLPVPPGAGAAEAAALDWMRGRLTAPREVTGESAELVESVLLRLPSRDLWFLRIHHLLADAYAFSLLQHRTAKLYTALLRGGEPPPDRSARLSELLAEEQRHRDSSAHAADLAHWAEQLTGTAEATRLGRAAPAAHRRHQVTGELPPESARWLNKSAEAEGTSWPALVAAGFADYAAAMTGNREVLLGLPLTGRGSSAALRAVATQVNVLPLRLLADPARPLPDAAREVSELLRLARGHQRARSEEIARALGDGPPVPEWTRAARINLKPFDTTLSFDGQTARVHPLATGPVEDIELTVSADDSSGALRLVLDANPDSCTAEEARAHHTRLLERLLAAAESVGPRTDEPAPALAGLPVATAAERARLARWNATDHPVPDSTLTELLAQALDRPARPGEPPALVWEGGELSRYGLARRSRTLARRLTESGVRCGDTVAVAAPRGPELVVGLLAALEAGAGYLPLDLDAPPARAAELLRQARPAAALAGPGVPDGPHGRALSGPGLPLPVLEIPAVTADARDAAPPGTPRPGRAALDRPLTPADPAYVIFTSGSTGAPKGVVVPHAGIVNRLAWMQHALELRADDVVLQKTPVTFDVSVWEFFWPLLTGATLALLAPGAHRDPAAIAAAIAEHRVTTVHFVPSMLRESSAWLRLADADRRRLAPLLRRIVCSGEALDPAAVREIHELLPETRVFNLYGPTEASVDVSCWDCGSGRSPAPAAAGPGGAPVATVPIGTPVWNTRLAVLDAAGRELPPGGIGELHISGAQLASGYLGRPDLTAERFAPAAPGIAGTEGPGRWYRTGDRARWTAPDVGASGALEYLGRTDQQIKIRGQRIEPGEVEAMLTADPAVRAAAVLAVPDGAGDLRLAALVVPAEAPAAAPAAAGTPGPAAAPTRAPLAAEVRQRLADRLPPAMVPRIVAVPELPTSRHGKLDLRRAAELATAHGPDSPDRLDSPDSPDRLDSPPNATARPGSSSSSGSSGPSGPSGENAWSALAGPFTAQIRAALAEVLGHDGGLPDDNFFAVGGDSLKAARLSAALHRTVPGRVEFADVFTAGTLGRLVRLAESGGRLGGSGPATAVVLPLRPAGREVVAGIHPAGGLSWCYAPLLRHLPVDTALFGLQSPVFGEAEAGGQSLDQLALRYADELGRIADGRPVHLTGWSVGGVIAQAVAAHASAGGTPVASVTLLDAYPSAAWRALPAPEETDTARALATMGGLDADALAADADRPLTIAAAQAALHTAGSPLALLPAQVLDALPSVVTGHVRALREHREPVIGTDLTVVHATRTTGPAPLTAGLWSHATTGTVRVVPYDGRHPDLVRDRGLRLLARLLPLGT